MGTRSGGDSFGVHFSVSGLTPRWSRRPAHSLLAADAVARRPRLIANPLGCFSQLATINDSSHTSWPLPTRILLLTYSRIEHVSTSYKHSVIVVPGDRASGTKLKRMRVGDRALVRVSEFEEFQASRPARITGKVVDQRRESPYPALLWEEEAQQSKLIYPFRMPVTFDNGPRTKPHCVNWKRSAL